jgi:hypothetical protein
MGVSFTAIVSAGWRPSFLCCDGRLFVFGNERRKEPSCAALAQLVPANNLRLVLTAAVPNEKDVYK